MNWFILKLYYYTLSPALGQVDKVYLCFTNSHVLITCWCKKKYWDKALSLCDLCVISDLNAYAVTFFLF